jgi:ABC-type iron transport system FetAB permease component
MKTRTSISISILVLFSLLISNCATTSKMLMQSAKRGYYAKAKRLIKEEADVNATNYRSFTALI